MRTLTASIAGLTLAVGAYAVVQTTTTRTDPDERSASISCWWTPPEREGTVSWTFGSRPPGSDVVTGPTRNGPFMRKSKVKVGEVVHLDLRFVGGGWLTARGLYRSCTARAGANSKTSKASNHLALTLDVTAV